MKGLEFLKKASLAPNEAVKTAVARTSTAKARNPETADIRVFKDGSVYPSAALVAEFNLGYQPKDATPRGQAFDVFKSTDYINTKDWAADDKVIFITAVDRSEPKTDLFSSSKFDENGEPTADVLTQGANTFGKLLLEYIKEVYDVEPTEEEGFVDLSIVRDIPFTTPDSIYYVPKVISRGEKKGQSDLLRRENLTLYPLVPAAMLATPDNQGEYEDTKLSNTEQDAAESVPAQASAAKATKATVADAPVAEQA